MKQLLLFIPLIIFFLQLKVQAKIPITKELYPPENQYRDSGYFLLNYGDISDQKIIRSLSSNANSIRKRALWSIGSKGLYSDEILRQVRKSLFGKNIELRLCALWAMGRLGGNAAFSNTGDLVKSALDQNVDIRRYSLWAIGKVVILNPNILEKLIPLAGDKSILVKQEFVKLLSNIDREPALEIALPLLKSIIENSGSLIKKEVLNTLENIYNSVIHEKSIAKKNQRIFKRIIGIALIDKNQEIRQRAFDLFCRVKSMFDNKEKILISFLADENLEISKKAQNQVNNLYLGRVQVNFDFHEKNIKGKALYKHLGFLFKKLSSRNPKVRLSAIKVFKLIPWVVIYKDWGLKITRALIRLMADEAWYVRLEAYWAMANIAEGRTMYLGKYLSFAENKNARQCIEKITEQALPLYFNKLKSEETLNRLLAIRLMDFSFFSVSDRLRTINSLFDENNLNITFALIKKIKGLEFEKISPGKQNTLLERIIPFLKHSNPYLVQETLKTLTTLLPKRSNKDDYEFLETLYDSLVFIYHKLHNIKKMEKNLFRLFAAASPDGLSLKKYLRKVFQKSEEEGQTQIFSMLPLFFQYGNFWKTKSWQAAIIKNIIELLQSPNPIIAFQASQALVHISRYSPSLVSKYASVMTRVLSHYISVHKEEDLKVPAENRNIKQVLFAVQVLSNIKRALDQAGLDKVISVLKSGLIDTDPLLRITMLEALGNFKLDGRIFFPILREFARDPDPRIQEKAILAMASLTSYRDKVKFFLIDSLEEKSLSAIIVLSSLNEFADEILPLLSDIYINGKIFLGQMEKEAETAFIFGITDLSLNIGIKKLKKYKILEVLKKGLSHEMSSIRIFSSFGLVKILNNEGKIKTYGALFYPLILANTRHKSNLLKVLSLKILKHIKIETEELAVSLKSSLFVNYKPWQKELVQSLPRFGKTSQKIQIDLEQILRQKNLSKSEYSLAANLLCHLSVMDNRKGQNKLISTLEWLFFHDNKIVQQASLERFKFLIKGIKSRKKFLGLVPLLKVKLYDIDQASRMHCLGILSELAPDDKEVRELCQVFFRFKENIERFYAAKYLGKIIKVSGKKPNDLIRESAGKDLIFKIFLLKVLRNSGTMDTYVKNFLIKSLKGNNWILRYTAMNLLKNADKKIIQQKEFQEIIRDIYLKDDLVFRQFISKIIQGKTFFKFYTQKEILKSLFQSAEDADWFIRMNSLAVINKIYKITSRKDKESLHKIVLSQVADENWRVRLHAMKIAGNIGPGVPEAVPFLISNLRSPKDKIRAQSLWALGRMGPMVAALSPAYIEEIFNSIEDSSDLVKIEALYALHSILFSLPRDKNYKAFVKKLLILVKNPKIQDDACDILAVYLGEDNGLREILEDITDESWLYFKLWLDNVLKPGEKLEYLYEIFFDEGHKQNRLMVLKEIFKDANLLKNKDLTKIIAVLVEALNDKDDLLRIFILNHLSINKRIYIPKLDPAQIYSSLASENWHVRYWALITLSEFQMEPGIMSKVLSLTANDKNENVRFASDIIKRALP